jgi:stearoyl-CoA desaturase (delta-9 desaturase)
LDTLVASRCTAEVIMDALLVPERALTPVPETPDGPEGNGSVASRIVTASLVVAPGIALGILLPLMWGNAVTLRDLVLAAVLYIVTGHGVTVGFHRLFTHSSFVPSRPLKIALAVTGSMALEGSVVGWVANHRRHHMYSDREGDPHSPWRYGAGPLAQLRGLAWAHIGWLFATDTTSARRFAPDLLDDRDIATLSRLFPIFAIASLALPFALGWLLAGTIGGALSALVWAGVVRMALLHHVTWSVNSLCHMFGKRAYRTADRSRNLWSLAVLSFGESWHNFHHAFPSSARHGAMRHQIDSSAAVIRLFERFGWVTRVRWPTPARIAQAQV